MHGHMTVLANLPVNKNAKIIDIDGGRHFHQKMCVMNLRVGQIVEVVSRQPFRGPLTVKVGNCKITMGRGMAHRIHVEEI